MFPSFPALPSHFFFFFFKLKNIVRREETTLSRDHEARNDYPVRTQVSRIYERSGTTGGWLSPRSVTINALPTIREKSP